MQSKPKAVTQIIFHSPCPGIQLIVPLVWRTFRLLHFVMIFFKQNTLT